MATLFEVAREHERRRVKLADTTARQAVRLFRALDPAALDAGWDRIAPLLAGSVTRAQVTAARQASAFTSATVGDGDTLIPEAFGGVSREGRDIVPEMYASVTTAKAFVSRGSGVPAAFQAGATVMSIVAATLVSDAGRSADRTLSFARGTRTYVRVVSAGACSRCAILAGVTGYREDFKRHPRCRCTSMPIPDSGVIPDGFHDSPTSYFESLSAPEQERVFTKAGAEAIRAGADPVKVVNARRGALKSVKRPDGSYSLARLRPMQIGRNRDGSPLLVYATPEGTTARSSWARSAGDLTRQGNDRYRRTRMVRLMPEQIMQMTSDPARALELLKRYGYVA